MKSDLPFCSIIILNYFGEKVISNTVKAVASLEYPKNKYEIIIVDNNSLDKSKTILKKLAKKYKQIKLIFSEKNLGFAAGNNLGLKQSKGKYAVLLNNDCIVDKRWLLELVKTIEKDESVFSVNSKILLYPKYFSIKFKISGKFFIEKIYLYKSNLLKFTKWKRMPLNLNTHKDYYQLEIPYDPIKDKTIEIFFVFKKTDTEKKFRRFDIRFLGTEKNSCQLLEEKNTKKRLIYRIKLTPSSNYFNKIQNAGIIVFQDGYGRDIGSIVNYKTQNYEKDSGQYDKEREVYASCGAASLYRKSIFDKIGYLDESFFMYYEDVEICERARLYGYKTVYCPTAIVRHLHALSSIEWSPFFIYHAEKGRLLHILYNFPLRIFISEYFKFTIKNFLKVFLKSKSIKEIYLNFQYIKIIFYFLVNSHSLLIKRSHKHKNINNVLIAKNYKKIIEGYWYFN